MRAKDLTPALIAREKAPKPTWFVRRGDGMEFCVQEKEAWDILHNDSQWKRHDFTFFGYSDGKTYQRVAAEAMAEATRLAPEVERLRKEVNRYRTLEDRIMLEDVIDMEGDPTDLVNEANKAKILRLHKIIEREDAKLEKVERELNASTAGAVKRATAAEREVAMANWAERRVWPADDLNVLTPGASRAERAKIMANGIG